MFGICTCSRDPPNDVTEVTHPRTLSRLSVSVLLVQSNYTVAEQIWERVTFEKFEYFKLRLYSIPIVRLIRASGCQFLPTRWSHFNSIGIGPWIQHIPDVRRIRHYFKCLGDLVSTKILNNHVNLHEVRLRHCIISDYALYPYLTYSSL